MTIDTSGNWWTGTEPADIAQYLVEYSADGYRVDRVEPARCATCAGEVFRLRADRRQGCVERACAGCGAKHLMVDSSENRAGAKLRPLTCPCGNAEFNTAVGFAHRDGGEVRWVYVGIRCATDGVLGCVAEWGISSTSTEHLYASV